MLSYSFKKLFIYSSVYILFNSSLSSFVNSSFFSVFPPPKKNEKAFAKVFPFLSSKTFCLTLSLEHFNKFNLFIYNTLISSLLLLVSPLFL